jgi:hypothetical protein
MRQPFEPIHEGPDKACATLGGSRLNFFAASGVLISRSLYQKRHIVLFFDKSPLFLLFLLRKFLPIVLYRCIPGKFAAQGMLGE